MTQQRKRPCDWDESALVKLFKDLPVKLPEPERKKS